MILTLNVGSSSLKYALYDEQEKCLESGEVKQDVEEVLKKVPKFDLVGHRIVHGGSFFTKPTRISDSVIEKLEALIPFSPLHLPAELAVVKKLHGMGVAQVACFDTAFHRATPKLHQHFPLPAFLWKEGIKRYGFHGLSYEYIMAHLGEEGKTKRIIIAHLGNGASMAAVLKGKPIDTTMGFTPAGGIMMGTRSGDLDPGVLSYLMRIKGYGPAQIDALVNHQSGLMGISEKTSDMKQLLELRTTDQRADDAITLFCYIARKAIGALTAALGGLDLLVFTGGIGEHAKEIRDEICKGLEFLDIANKTQVIPTNENLMIARHTLMVTGGK
ncbi:MAG: Acetate kinase [Chlamydiae bacterium]|nr:Acetate kinase [Chlamydiota bacterium]